MSPRIWMEEKTIHKKEVDFCTRTHHFTVIKGTVIEFEHDHGETGINRKPLFGRECLELILFDGNMRCRMSTAVVSSRPPSSEYV